MAIALIGIAFVGLLIWKNHSDYKARWEGYANRARRAAAGDLDAKREIDQEEAYALSEEV